MNVRSFLAAARARTVVALIATVVLLASALPAGAEWRHARGDSANTSFARVDTQPAVAPQMSRIVGPVAPGANPVIGPTGKVYIGNLRGELHAFYAEGLEYWTRQLNPEHGGIFASPVVLPDGTIFVVSTIHHTDSKDNESFLHRFNPDGTRLFSVPFPKSPYLPFTDGGATTAPPNLWRWNGDEAIMVPVVYQGLGRDGVSVIAFGRNGDVQGNHLVGTNVYEITSIPSEGFSECVNRNSWLGPLVWPMCAIANLGVNFIPPIPVVSLLRGASIPVPGVAIVPDTGGGAPLILATDRRRTRVALSFSPQAGFAENARSTSTRHTFTTTPVLHRNGVVQFGTGESRLARNLSESSISELGELEIFAAPTRLHDGRLVVLTREGRMTALGTPTVRQSPGGETIASAAASCTHVFVSTTDGLFTFRADTMGQVARANVPGGGLSAPVIGPTGAVYVVGQDTLYTFPGRPTGGVVVRTACDTLAPPY